ncbi:MAG: carboxypeptidase-like regulatory domain-containing protein [Candidatus Zixiibacteriota bacterium]
MRSFAPLITLVALTLIGAVCHHQEWKDGTGRLEGYVKDSTTGQPLTGVSVMIVSSTVGAISDSLGFYRVKNIPPGIYRVYFSCVGYRRMQATDVEIRSGVTIRIDINLAILESP